MGASLHHLPDLPDAGYATRRQRETTDAIMFFMRKVERDRPLLLAIVIDGLEKWLKTAGRVWKGLLIDRDLLTSIFQYFVLQAGPNPAQQLLILNGMAAQQARQVWDKRQRTVREMRETQAKALKELRWAQRNGHVPR